MTAPVVAPRYATPRDHRYKSMGPGAGKLGRLMGLPFMPWQQQVADTALEVDDRGIYRYGTVVLTVPRQSGKTSLLRPVMAQRCLAIPRGRVWLTAQLRQDARDTWTDTVEVIEDSPLAGLVTKRATNGSETLTFRDQRSTLRLFNAGSDKALHGKQSDLVFVDESFAFTEEQGDQILQAVIPTQATRPGAQLWIVSTAGTAASTWLRQLVLDGRAGAGRRTCYFEWSIPEDTEDLGDLETYLRYHPAVGHTIGREALESAQERMKPSEFARAYGNFWTSAAEWAIAPAIWQAAASTASVDRRRPFAIGIEVAANRSGGAIVACGTGAETGLPIMEIIDIRPGIGWIVERVLELLRAYPQMTIVIDPVSPAGSVHRKLVEHQERRHRVPLADFATAEYVDAHVDFLDSLTAGRLQQPNEPRLDTALAATTTRQLRDVTVFARTVADDGTAPAPLIASVLAHHGHLYPVPYERPRIHVAAG